MNSFVSHVPAQSVPVGDLLDPDKKEADDFRKYLVAEHCPSLDDARKIANGTKHFGLNKISTGKHQGAFSTAFQADAFDVNYLWIERGEKKQKAENFIREIIEFWDGFFSRNSL